MRTVYFNTTNRSGNILHVESENCIVNIRVGLRSLKGEEITSIEIIADQGCTLPDFEGKKSIHVRVAGEVQP